MEKVIEKVIISIRGGVAEVLEKSDNVTVEIRDYDVDGSNEMLVEDEHGDAYICSTYFSATKPTK